MKDEDLRKELDNLMERIKKSKEHWRFNYSVGIYNGGCYGASFEDENKMKDATHKNCELSKSDKKFLNKIELAGRLVLKEDERLFKELAKEQKGCGTKMDAIGYIHCGDYDDLKHGGKQWLCDKCKNCEQGAKE